MTEKMSLEIRKHKFLHSKLKKMTNNSLPTPLGQNPLNSDMRTLNDPQNRVCHQSLFNAKVIQKNAIYVIGITKDYSTPQILASGALFGQFGPISVIEMKSCPFNHFDDYTENYGAFITYEDEISAFMAICCLESAQSESLPLLQASIGSNKVCKRFLKKDRCKIKNCTYFHGIPNHDEIIVKHDDISNFCMFEVQKTSG
jgi:hypothetical protein